MADSKLLHSEIFTKLGRLRTALRGRLFGEGMAWLLIALVSLVFVTLAFDYLLHLDRLLRGLVLTAALAAVAWVFWRRLVSPLRVPMDSAALALLVEHHYDRLGDRLISAVQFSGAWTGRGDRGSEGMIEKMAQEANELASPLSFRQVVDPRGLWRAGGGAAAALVILMGFAVWQGEILHLWFQRNVLFAGVEWPQKTYLTVRGEHFRILRGDDLIVEIEIDERSEEVPAYVTLSARYPSVGLTQTRIEPEQGNPRKFVKVFPNVSEEFEFYVTGGDDKRDRSRPHRVSLIDPPALCDVRFTVKYHAYMNRGLVVFDGGSGVLSAPVGSYVQVVARANKDLAPRTAIMLDGKPVGKLSVETIRIRETDDDGRLTKRDVPRRVVGGFAVTGENRAAARTLKFALEDTEGFTNRRGQQYLLRVVPDSPPHVDARQHGVGTEITPVAIIPMLVAARDDCGILALRTTIRVRTLGADRSADADRQIVREIAPIPADRKEITDLPCAVDLKGLDFKVGQYVSVWVAADDTLPAEFGGPNTARSSVLTFRLIRPEDLMASLLRRQMAVRLEFSQAILVQVRARGECAEAAELLASGKITPDVRRLLRQSSLLQGGVGTDVSKVAETLAGLLEEMKNNRLGSPKVLSDLSKVVAALGELPDAMKDVTAVLNGTKSVQDAEELRAQATEIASIQDQIRRKMDEILKLIQKGIDRQAVINELKLIQKMWRELIEDTKKRVDDQLKKPDPEDDEDTDDEKKKR